MIVVGGENLIDLIQISDSQGAPEFRAVPGGSQYNCALALGRLGVATKYITPISTDQMGDMLASTLCQDGVEIVSTRIAFPTSLSVVTLHQGQPAYQIYREATAERQVTLESLRASIPTDIKIFQSGSLSLCDGADADAWADLFVELAGRGVFCALDPNVRDSFIRDREAYVRRLNRMMQVTSLLKLSDEDLNWLYPGEDATVKASELAAKIRAKLVVLTQGSQGATLISQTHKVTIPAVPIKNLKDTVGAGDTFMAALDYQMLQSPDLTAAADLKRIGEFAAKAAAINCTRTGCNPPCLNELEVRS